MHYWQTQKHLHNVIPLRKNFINLIHDKNLDLHINCYTSQHVTFVHILPELPKTKRKWTGVSYFSLCLNFLRTFTFPYPRKMSSSDNLKLWLDTVGIKAGVSRVNIPSAHFGKLGNPSQLQWSLKPFTSLYSFFVIYKLFTAIQIWEL